MKHKSIGIRMQKAGSTEVRLEIARDWSESWRREYKDLIAQLERAVSTMDYDALCSVTGQLKVVGQKRHDGLSGVIARLADQD